LGPAVTAFSDEFLPILIVLVGLCRSGFSRFRRDHVTVRQNSAIFCNYQPNLVLSMVVASAILILNTFVFIPVRTWSDGINLSAAETAVI